MKHLRCHFLHLLIIARTVHSIENPLTNKSTGHDVHNCLVERGVLLKVEERFSYPAWNWWKWAVFEFGLQIRYDQPFWWFL